MVASGIQIVIAVAGSTGFTAVIYRLARLQLLSFRYTIGWLVLSVFGGVAGISAPLAAPVADLIGISTGVFIGLLVVAFLVCLCIQLSISISGLQQQTRTLIEKVAQLEHSIDSQKTL